MSVSISYVNSAAATATSLTYPSGIQLGDVILYYGYRTAATAPTNPTGYTSISSASNATDADSFRVSYKIANGSESGTTSPTYTNATQVAVVVYRGVGAIGASANMRRTATPGTLPALTLTGTLVGSSWIIGFMGSKQGTSQTASGITNRVELKNSTTSMIDAWDTNAGVSSWAANNVTLGTSAVSYGVSIELIVVNSPPNTPTLISPADTSSVATTAPDLNFSTTDADSDAVDYEIQIDTSSTFNSTSGFLMPELRKSYSVYPGRQIAMVSVTAGDLIIVSCSYNSLLQSVACSDNASGGSNSYSQVGTGIDNSSLYLGIGPLHAGHVFYAIAKATEVLTISVTNETDIGIAVHVVANMNTTAANVLDSYASEAVVANPNTTLVTSAIPTTQQRDYLFVMWFEEESARTFTSLDNFAMQVNQNTHIMCTFDMIGFDIDSYTSSVGINNTIGYGVSYIIASFKSSSGNIPILDKFSSISDPTFVDVTNSIDTSPFASGDQIKYTPNSGVLSSGNTYYWRLRAKDQGGSRAYSNWSSPYSFSISVPSSPTNLFFF